MQKGGEKMYNGWKGMKAVGYVRISTNEDKQKYGLKVQLEAIKEFCRRNRSKLMRIYIDKTSGFHNHRKGLQRMLSEKERFDVVVLYKIDRLSRSLFELLKLIHEDLRDHHVVFIQEGIDQRTKEGRLLLHQLASFAEYERELIVSRIKDGLAEARKRGVRLGAKPKWPQYKEQVREMRAKGMTWRAISEALGIDYRTCKKSLTFKKICGKK